MANDDWYDTFVRNVDTALRKRGPKKRLYKSWRKAYFKNLFFDDLKIIGGAFTVLEAVSDRPLLLFRKDYNHSREVRDPECDFFWFPYEAKHFTARNATIIDRLFLTAREAQRLTENAPDFLRFIRGSKYEFDFITNRQPAFSSQPIIYCDNSELLIVLLCYLELVNRIRMGLNKELLYSANSAEEIAILNDGPNTHNTLEDVFSDYWEPASGILNLSTYRGFGLANEKGSPTQSFKKLSARLKYIASSASLSKNSKLDSADRKTLKVRSLDEIPSAVETLLRRVFKILEYGSYEASLQKLHKNARFPIIPYLEIFLRRRRKSKATDVAHFVLPVWQSFTFAPEVKIGQHTHTEHNVVLALLTLNDDHYSGKNTKASVGKLSRAMRRLGQVTADTIFYEKFAVKNIQLQAAKAAISQVLARNMSHNIGSHVLSNYKAETDFRRRTVCDEPQYLAGELNLNQEFTRGRKDNAKNIAIQRAYFNEYLKNRMDFLADVATTEPTLETPMYLMKDILAGFDKNRILLNRISGLDHGVTFDIALMKNGTPMKGGSHNDNTQDLSLSMPNDILGCQAFYVLIENIIRNITKHAGGFTPSGSAAGAPESANNAAPDFNFKVNIDIGPYKENKEFYELKIFDDLYDSTGSINQLVEDRNHLIGSRVLDEKTSRLRESGLGSIEMVVCAAYLRRIPLDYIQDDFYTLNKERYRNLNGTNLPNILYAYAQPCDSDSNRSSLGYKLYLRKPRKLLVFDADNSLRLEDKEVKSWREVGITILTSKRPFNERYEYSHDFVIWLNTQPYEEFYKKNRNLLPREARVLTARDFSGEGFSLNGDPIAIETRVWKVYLDKLLALPAHAGTDEQRDATSRLCAEYSRYPDKQYCYACGSNGVTRQIFIDDHHKNWKRKKDTDVYYEMCCSHHRLSKLDLSNEYDKMRYFDAVLTEVIIIDERIQANVANNNRKIFGVVPLRIYFEKLKVFIPMSDEVDLNCSDFHARVGEKAAVSQQLRLYLRGPEADGLEPGEDNPASKIATSDFCVIHLGVIEKLFAKGVLDSLRTFEEKVKAVERTINELVGDANRDKVVITSGRGKPTNISSRFRYIPLAVIQNSVESLFDKYLLVTALNNARRSK